MSQVDSLEAIRRDLESGQRSALATKQRANPDSLNLIPLVNEYLATARTRRALRLLLRGQDIIAA